MPIAKQDRLFSLPSWVTAYNGGWAYCLIPEDSFYKPNVDPFIHFIIDWIMRRAILNVIETFSSSPCHLRLVGCFSWVPLYIYVQFIKLFFSGIWAYRQTLPLVILYCKFLVETRLARARLQCFMFIVMESELTQGSLTLKCTIWFLYLMQPLFKVKNLWPWKLSTHSLPVGKINSLLVHKAN